MADKITYNTDTLLMIEIINGDRRQQKFDTVEELLDDKKQLEEYFVDFPEQAIPLVIKSNK